MDNEISLRSLSDMLGMHKTEPQMWPKWNKVAGGAQGAKWTMVKRTSRDTRAHCRRINQWRMEKHKEMGAAQKKNQKKKVRGRRTDVGMWVELKMRAPKDSGSRTWDSWPVICDDSPSMSSVARKNKGLRSEVNPLGKGNLTGFTLPPGHLKDLTCFTNPTPIPGPKPSGWRMNCERAIDFSCLGFVSLCARVPEVLF